MDQLLDLWLVSGNDVDGVFESPILASQPLPTDGTATDASHQTRLADVILGIDVQPSPIPSPGTTRADFPRMRWDYAVSFDSHRLVALDTRTWRYFPDATPFAWPSDIPPAQQTPRDTATLKYLEQAADAWATVATTVGSDEASTFVELFRACIDAAQASDAPTTEAHLLAAAKATETLLTPPFWSPAAFDNASVEIEHFREFLNPIGNDTSGDAPRENQLWQGALFLENVAAIPTEVDVEPLSHAFAALGSLLESAATGTSRALAAGVSKVLKAVGKDAVAVFTTNIEAQDTLALVVNAAGPLVAAFLDDLVPDRLSEWFFRDGSHQLGAALIADGALKFQLTEAIGTTDAGDPDGSDAPPLILLSPAPIFGNSLAETLQRATLIKTTFSGLPGAEEADYEAWSVNLPALNSLFLAARALPRCVVLSGDVHYANSSVNDVDLLSDGLSDNVATRYIQLTSSSARNATDGFEGTMSLGLLDDMLWRDDGEFVMSQMSLSKIVRFPGQAAEEGDEGSLIGWVQEMAGLGSEVATDWVKGSFSLENFVVWINEQLDDVPKTLPDLIRWQIEAPYNTATAAAAEVAYMTFSAINFVLELWDDPMSKVFGDYLYTRDVLRQQLVDFYNAWGVDPALGHQVRRTMLRDRRHLYGPRLDLYQARIRFKPDSSKAYFANQQWVQTVGGNNVGLVRFGTDGNVVRSVRHELLWYLEAAPELKTAAERLLPAGLVVGAPPRNDWMGTVHECSWKAYAHRLPDPPSDLPSDPVVS